MSVCPVGRLRAHANETRSTPGECTPFDGNRSANDVSERRRRARCTSNTTRSVAGRGTPSAVVLVNLGRLLSLHGVTALSRGVNMLMVVAIVVALGLIAMTLAIVFFMRQRAPWGKVPTGQQDEASLYALANCAHDGILINCEDNIVFVNRRMCELVDYTREELIGTPFSRLIADPEMSVGLCRYLVACPQCQFPGPIEDVFRSRHHGNIPVEVSVGAGSWSGRQATIVIVRDVSERMRTEAHARETDELLRQIADNIREVFFVRDLDQDRMIYVSPAYTQIWGRPVQRCYEDQMDFVASVHPDDKSRVMAGVAGQRKGRFFHGEYRIVRPDGQVRWIWSRTFPVHNERGEIYRVAGIAEDITERKAVEEALRTSERQLREIVDLVPHKIFAKDELGRFLMVNEAVARFYGKTIEEIEGMHQASLHDDSRDADVLLAADREVIATGRPKYIPQEIFRNSEGHLRVFETIKIPYATPDGARRAVLGVSTDITARTEAEEALRASERKYRLLMEHASDAIVLGDINGRLYDCNRRAEELLGYSRDEIAGLYVTDIYPAEAMATVHEAFTLLETDEVISMEVVTARKDRTTFVAEVNSTLIQHGDSVWVHAIFRDITARKLAETERLEQAKLQRDTLVREVHHRIKNNLQGVAGLLRQHATRHPTLKEPLEAAIGQVHSMAIVHGLQGHITGKGVTLCELTLAICKAASGVTGRTVDPLVELAIEEPIHVNEDEAVPLALVLNELVFNAIKHGPVEGVPVKVKIHEAGAQAYVKVENAGGRLPEGFDFDRGIGLGTGLRLVRSLLPPQGIMLTLEDGDSGVVCELELCRPVVDLPRKRSAEEPRDDGRGEG